MGYRYFSQILYGIQIFEKYDTDFPKNHLASLIVRQKRHKISNKEGATITLYPYWLTDNDMISKFFVADKTEAEFVAYFSTRE